MKRKPIIACIILLVVLLAAAYMVIAGSPFHQASMALSDGISEQRLVHALDADESHSVRIVGCRQLGANLLVLYSFVENGKDFVGLVQMDGSLNIAKTHFVDRYDDNAFGYYRRIAVGEDTAAVFGLCYQPDKRVVLYQGLIPQKVTPEKGFYLALLPAERPLNKIVNGDLVIQTPQASLEAAAIQYLTQLLSEGYHSSIHLVGLEVKEVNRYQAYRTTAENEAVYAARILFEPATLRGGVIEYALWERDESTYKGIGEITPELKTTWGTTNAACRQLASAWGIEIEQLDGTVNHPAQNNIRYLLPETAAQDEKEAAHLLVQAFFRDLSNENIDRQVPARSFVITDFTVSDIDIPNTPLDADHSWDVAFKAQYHTAGYLHGEKDVGMLRLERENGCYRLTSPLALPDRQREYGGLSLDSFVLTGISPGDDMSAGIKAFLNAMIDENRILQAFEQGKADIGYRLEAYTYSAEESAVKVQASIRSIFKNVPGEGIQIDVETGKYNVPNDWLSGLGTSKSVEGNEILSQIDIMIKYDAGQDVWRFSQLFP